MIPAKVIWKPIVQKAVTGHARRFRMAPREPRWPRDVDNPAVCENCGGANGVEVSQMLALRPAALAQVLRVVRA